MAYPIHTRARARGFTFVELLVVMGIIIVILAMIIPLFSSMLSGKGIETSQNRISAMLARARTEAIGLQQKVGVVFYVNPVNKRQMMVIVLQNANPLYIELDSNSEITQLPTGTGAQFFNNASRDSNGIALGEIYIHQPGLILFDSRGMLTNERYEIAKSSKLGAAMGLTVDTSYGYYSQIGLVLYDTEAFHDQGFSDDDTPTPWLKTTYQAAPGPGGAAQSEENEEKWLDGSFTKLGQTTPLLVNRYNGTLIKGD